MKALTMKTLTHKQILDKAIKGVLDQGHLSYRGKSSSPTCLYRSVVEGKKCACGIGQLISDEDYAPKMEGVAVKELPEILDDTGYFHQAVDQIGAALAFNGVDFTRPKTQLLLCDIQHAHDACAGNKDEMNAFKKNARELYVKYRLPIPSWL